TNGGSGYFDGSGDYIQTQTSAILGMGSGDFTVEGWYYVTNTTDYRYLFDLRIDGANTNTFGAYLNTGTMNLLVFVGPSGDIASGSLTLNSWNHVAVVRSGSTVTTYINGVASGTPISSSQNLSDATYLTLGRRYTVAQYYTGYISCFRMVKGTALYTSNFTPPTTPPTAITNTSLLLNFTNAGIIDNTAKNDLVTVNSAQISTAQSKFGGASMLFDGTTDYLTLQANPDLALGSGDWTVECWVYLNATANEVTVFGSKNYYVSGKNGNFVLRVGNNNVFWVFNGQTTVTNISPSSGWSTGVWTHAAWVRSSGTVTVYRNGVSIGSTANTTDLVDSANGGYIAVNFSNGSLASGTELN
ncbi:MAG: LamG domain-containing protein, partial [Proteobacteria bacterium]|nr:LamG domain-containing protein [Pseudomonadota bacterium]